MIMQESKEISDYKKNLRGVILDTAIQAFAQKGIRAVKMDDVAAALGISKRTLYEIFETKEILLFEGIKKYYAERQEYYRQQTQRCKNVMEMLVAIYRIKVDEFRKTNPQFYADLDMYPKVGRFLNQQNLQMRTDMLKFMDRGIYEGYFRDDVNYELAWRLFDALGKYVMVNQLYRQYTIEEIFQNLVFVTMRGLCTEKGIKALDSIV
jgi:AcrR family transcriptional regulator